MPRPQLVLLGRLPLAHKITQGLGGFIWNPHRRQIISVTVAAGQLQSISPICLHPVSGLFRDQRFGFVGQGTSRKDDPCHFFEDRCRE
jgi:hypothetical protein